MSGFISDEEIKPLKVVFSLAKNLEQQAIIGHFIFTMSQDSPEQSIEEICKAIAETFDC